MILGFKEYYPFQPSVRTLFKERILVKYYRLRDSCFDDSPYFVNFIKPYLHLHPKIHTIRKGKRWKKGDKIQMAYNVRSSDYYCFNKGLDDLEYVRKVSDITIIPCIDKATFSYEYLDNIDVTNASSLKGTIVVPFPEIIIDGKQLNDYQVLDFIRNDGFDNPFYFQMWFNEKFEGQLIQWTDYEYNKY